MHIPCDKCNWNEILLNINLEISSVLGTQTQKLCENTNNDIAMSDEIRI